MKTLTMVGYGLLRVLRYKANWFFLFLFPMLLILVIGAAFGGTYTPRVGVVAERSGALGDDLVARLSRTEGISVTRVSDEDSLLADVERGRLAAGVVVPPGYDARLRGGSAARVNFVARPDAGQLQTTVAAAVAGQDAVVRAARVAVAEGVASFDAALPTARRLAREDPGIGVDVRTVGDALFPTTLGRFDVGAGQELVLFVFLMSMIGAVGLIESRRLGVIRRMLSTPTSARAILVGEGLGRLTIALVQALVIILGSALLFGVDWGNPFAAGLLVLSFGLVGTGAGMLLGSVFRTEQQTIAVSLLLGLGLAALGGAMVPIEVFSDTMTNVAHVAPHAWALDGFGELVRHGAGVREVLPQVGVLLAYAAVLLTVASWRLRRVITR